MKLTVLIILLFPFFASAQLRQFDNELVIYDTTKYINLAKSFEGDILIQSSAYSVSFNKKIIIRTIDDILEEIKSSGDLDPWQLRHIERINSVKEFFTTNKSVEWTDYWKEEEPLPLDSVKDGEPFAKAIFWELACPSLESGQFKLIVDSKTKDLAIETSAQINGLGATVFITIEGKPFWMCPPLIID